VTETIVVAAPGGEQAVTFVYRLRPLQRAGPWPMEVHSIGSLPTAEQVETLIESGGRGRVLVLHRVVPGERDMERLRGRYDAIVFDFDDAIYAVPPDVGGRSLTATAKKAARVVARGSASASARRRPLERVLPRVDVCVAANGVLLEYARLRARRAIEIPTTVQPVDAPPAERPSPPVVAWMGVPDNLQYLALVRRPLEALAREIDFRVRIISSRPWSEAGSVDPEFVAWEPSAAREALLAASVGLAPLTDDAWTRGKSALRSIQYGGHALPTVASPVGITDAVVVHGETGYLARSEDEWVGAIRSLLVAPEQVERMGAAALDRVRRRYSDEVALELWRALFSSLV
jgi:glycosyltransferase involved in cell wall biosynthesis